MKTLDAARSTALPVAARAVALLAMVAPLLAACGGNLLEPQRIEYKTAGKLPPLEIPPDLTAPGRDDRFTVPDTAPSGSATLSTYNAERAATSRQTTGSDVLPGGSQVRMERSGTQRWLVVPESPDKVWSVVKDFWQEMGLLVNVEHPEVGVMETEWSENRAKLPQDLIRNTLGRVLDTLYSTGERDKYRTRLERGAQPGTTEIYISHRGMEEVYQNANAVASGDRTTRWQPRPSDPDLEAEFLARLMMRFGVAEARAREQVASGPAERARIASTKEGAVLLQLEEPFDRAWRRVGLALDRVGFTVEDRDRAKGFYFVRYVDPQQDAEIAKKNQGFLSRLFSFGSKPDTKPEQYRVTVRDSGAKGADSSQVEVLSRDGAADRSDTAKRILTLLHQQLK
jgi:outer membrane protein assembly factor BamC